jgi:undecaprenyl-diphosphatase
MLNNFIALISLGIVQGIAEFLPISSSGHLVIFENIEFFRNTIDTVSENSLLFINVSLHFATLIAVIIYLRKDIIILIKGLISGIREKDYKRNEIIIIRNILIASLPAGIIGIIFHDFFEQVFSSITIVFYMLIINGIILLSSKIIPLNSRKINEIGVIKAIVTGFFQAIAILPGISRSGMTITGGMMTGLKPEEAAKFSFLMAVPVIAGAGLLELIKAIHKGVSFEMVLPLSISMIITIAVALISLKIIFYAVRKLRIDLFGYYTILIGILGLIFFSK